MINFLKNKWKLIFFQEEDDGVILCAGVFGQERETDVCLLILDAKNLEELGRSTFSTPGPVPKCLHGWFAPDKNNYTHDLNNN